MAESTTAVKSLSAQDPLSKPATDIFNFSPPVDFSHSTTSRNKELTRQRLSMAGFDPMQAQRAVHRSQQPDTSADLDNRPCKRRQRTSKSFSSIKSSNLHSIRASYQAVKANAKQRIQTVTSSKRRATSQEPNDTAILHRPRSLFGLRPSTAGFASRLFDDGHAIHSPPPDPLTSTASPHQWTQLSGAAARQSARDFGKQPQTNRPRDDSAFGEHRTNLAENRESGISLVMDLETLHINENSARQSIEDVVRFDPICYLPSELSALVLSFLDMKELVVCERVSRQWQKLTQDPCVRRQEFMREWSSNLPREVLPPAVGGLGLGVPRKLHQSWTRMHRARQELADRWREGPNNQLVSATYLNGHTDSVYCVQFDEYKAITGSRDRTFRVWDVKSGELQVTVGVPQAHDSDRRHGPRIGTQESLAGPMRVVNRPMALGQYIVPSFYHNASILCLQFDQHLLVTGSSDHSLIMWDVNTFRPIRRLSHHSAGVLDIAFDGAKIVSCSKDGTICVWDRITGELLSVLVGHRGPVNAVQMRGDTIVTASGEGCAKLWQLHGRELGTKDAIMEGRCLKEFRSKDRGLACVEFSADGKFVMAGGNDKVIYKFDAESGKLVEIYKGHKGLVRSLYLDQPNRRIVTGSYDNELKCWDLGCDQTGNGGGVERWGLSRWATSWILSAKSDYRRLITTSQDGRALLLDFGIGVDGIDLLES